MFDQTLFYLSDTWPWVIQYSQRHTGSMINHCDRHTTHLSDLDISFVLLNISSKFLLHLECYLLSSKRHVRISKWIKQTKRYISITKKSDNHSSITVIYHSMSLTVLYLVESTKGISFVCFLLFLFKNSALLLDNA